MSSPQHEPTMEEILASIRKIISEDTPEGQPAAEAAAEAPAATLTPEPVKVEADDVLELTQEVAETPPPAPIPEPPKADDIMFEPMDEPAAAPVSADHDGIFSDHTRKAMDDTFAAIPDEPEAPAPAPRQPATPIAPVDGSSVENVFERAVRESFEPVLQKYLSDNSGVVIDRMKPLIREWMDEHFPALLEGAVRAEVERVVKARGKR